MVQKKEQYVYIFKCLREEVKTEEGVYYQDLQDAFIDYVIQMRDRSKNEKYLISIQMQKMSFNSK